MFRSIDFRKHAFGVLVATGFLVWLSNVVGGTAPAPIEHRYSVREVSAADAKALIDGGALVVDVREKDAFNSGHIPGAIAIPLDDLRARIPAALEGAKTMSIVIYCGDGVTHGPEGTEILNKAGYPEAVNLKPGLDGWEKSGYPVAKG
jgi:rhodanese-related sulfurtransferase